MHKTNEGKHRSILEEGNYGNVDVVRLLLEEGANPEVKNKHGLSPLEVALSPDSMLISHQSVAAAQILEDWRVSHS
jgi:ankyrin repeat protein